MSKFDTNRKGMFKKKPDVSTLKWTPAPDPNKKSKLPKYNVTTNISSRPSDEQIHEMEQKLDKFMIDKTNSHPLIGLLDKRQIFAGKNRVTKSLSTHTIDDQPSYYYSDELPESFSLKNDTTFSHDIHRAREVQTLIENRRRFFDGELNTTFDKVGSSQIMKGMESSDDDEDTKSDNDSGRATFGSSQDEQILEVITPPINLLYQSSGYSEDDELSIGDTSEIMLGKLTLFQQKTQSFLKENTERDNRMIATYNKTLKETNRTYDLLSITKSILERPINNTGNNFPVNYKPDIQIQKKKVRIIPKHLTIMPRKMSPNVTKNGFMRSYSVPNLAKPKRKLRKFWKLSRLPNETMYDETTDKDSSDNEFEPPMTNLESLASTEPADEHTFSMTNVIETTREIERMNDIRIGLTDPSKLSKKIPKERYGPIVGISTRSPGGIVTGKDFSQLKNPPGISWRSSIITPTTPNKSIPSTTTINEEISNSKLMMSQHSQRSMNDKYENLSPMREIEKTNAYATWKLDKTSNGILPSVILPSNSRRGIRKPERIQNFEKSKSEKNVLDIISDDNPVTPTSLKRQPFIAFRGHTRPITSTRREKDFVPMKDEESTGGNEEHLKLRKKNPYNNLQRKRISALPDELDYTMDPRYLSLLEVLEPCYEPHFSTWKNKPTKPVHKTIPSPQVPVSIKVESQPLVEPMIEYKPKSYPPFPGPNQIPLFLPKDNE